MAVRTTKITIETEGVLIACFGRRVITWCPECKTEVPALLLEDQTQTPQATAALPTGAHVWTPEAGTLICLSSLSQWSQELQPKPISDHTNQGEEK